MPMSVDLPAPFGPSNPRISPQRAVRETRDSARRRPKWRETSDASTRSKSTSGRQPRAIGRPEAALIGVERAVDAFQGSDQLLASRSIFGRVSTAVPVIVLEPDQLLKEFVATGHQAL